jgi:hypothetical protein
MYEDFGFGYRARDEFALRRIIRHYRLETSASLDGTTSGEFDFCIYSMLRAESLLTILGIVRLDVQALDESASMQNFAGLLTNWTSTEKLSTKSCLPP